VLLKRYRKEFCRPPNPEAQHLRCVAYLDENIGNVLPYLNTVLKGHQYIKNPPSLTLKFNGKLITLYSQEIVRTKQIKYWNGLSKKSMIHGKSVER